jgi:prepilin-type N-terminal cleavage/methylation domain-containing protein
MKNKLPMADGQLPVAEQSGRAVSPLTAVGAHGVTRPARSIANRESKIVNGFGFTLVELLVVISIIAILAAFTVPVLSSVKRRQYISQAQGELGQLKAAIDSYHAAYGFYPPGNQNGVTNASGKLLGNQLYYELVGTTNTGGAFHVINNPGDQLSVTPVNQVQAAFGVAGFVNCSKPGSGEDSPSAKNFILDLRPNQTGIFSNVGSGFEFTILTGSVGGPDATYKPLNASGLNPWRYVSPGVNNPSSYDLWIQLSIHGKTNLICNWSKQVQINNPLP